MVVAIYRSNSKCSREEYRVHKYKSDNTLHIECVTNSYAHEIGETYTTIEQVEKYIGERCRIPV